MPKIPANAVRSRLSRPLAALTAAALVGCIPYGNTLCWECAENDEECKKQACPSYTESDAATASDGTETGTTTSTTSMTTSTTDATTTTTGTTTGTTDDTTSSTTGGPCNYDLVCDPDEDAEDCLHDCGACQADGVCDGATETPHACPADCPATGCDGDGVVDALSEQCDDGNAEDGDACTNACNLAACGDGHLFAAENGGAEECDDGNLVDGDGCASDCTIERRTVFVTSDKYEGNFGGLVGADALCQELAGMAGLSGTFMAWLSVGGDSPSGPSDRFGIDAEFSGIFELVDGTEIAVGWPDLVDGSLAHMINIDDSGADVASSTVWTNTGVSGEPIDSVDCDAWTTADGLVKGVVGLSNQADNKWTEFEGTSCASSARLYCFQVQ